MMKGGADPEAAQEIAQEAMIMVWRKAASFDRGRASAATWINTIALNFYRSFLGRETLTQMLPDLPGRDRIDISAIDVDRLLRRCRPADRTLLQQHMEGVTMEEIARENGVTETAIRIRMMRARRAARGHLEKKAYRFRRCGAAAMSN